MGFLMHIDRVVIVLCLGLLAGSAAAQAPKPALRERMVFTERQQQNLRAFIAKHHEQYNPREKMIKRPLSSPGYHTTLKGGDVHPTRDSLRYAVACLDSGDERLRLRACDIIRRVISLQDQDTASKTYGIWSWFLEEPLEKMSPPDWNWADFCGHSLIQIILDHRDRIPADLAKEIDASIQHATRSIMKRNVGPSYTNIAILGTYVTMVAGELYYLPDVTEYAVARLQRFHEYTRETGGFTEFNSPTYTIVSLETLAQLRQDVTDASVRKLVDELYRLELEEIAHHFHPPTRQWSGPHSRTYRTLLGSGVLHIIERGTAGRVDFGTVGELMAIDEYRVGHECPRDLEPFFTKLDAPRMVVSTFKNGTPPVVGSTYLHPKFSLGTINRGDLWNQRRSLLAYFGSAEKPGYLHLRFLHDGYDFAAAQFFSAQKVGVALAGINFATDGGDTHVSLDRIKNATFRAKDLRLRFEFGGAAAGQELHAPAELAQPADLTFGDVKVRLAVPYAQWAGRTGRWEAGRDEKTAWLDVVLYAGEETTFKLTDLTAAIALAVEFTTAELAIAPKAAVENGRLIGSVGELKLDVPFRPDTVGKLQAGSRAGR